MGEIFDVVRLRDIINIRVLYQIPLHHDKPQGELTTVAGTLTQKYDEKLHGDYQNAIGKELSEFLPAEPKIIVYFQGGPGFPCVSPSDKDGIAKFILGKDYQIFYLDQRGTGFSTPIDAERLEKVAAAHAEDEKSATAKQLDYILQHRADSIVEDAEWIRKDLLKEKTVQKWSVIGQSYGGFCIFTYLSRYPDSIKEALITGGVPPVNHTVDDVYQATYERTKERNVHYYRKYPQDVSRVRRIANHLSKNETKLPNGGTLSVERFQTLGLSFGGFGGTDSIHQLVLKLDYDIRVAGKPTYSTLIDVQSSYSFDTNIIYALFQEAIYCDGNNHKFSRSNWSADRLRYASTNENFVHDKVVAASESEPFYFTGEMVYKSMFEDYSELKKLKPLAHALHDYEDWTPLYDTKVLEKITWEKVPIVAATYVYDQYVDFDITRKVKKEVFKNNGNLRQYITSDFFHNGIRANPDTVLGALFNLLDGELD